MRAYYNEFDPYAATQLRNLIAAGHIADGDVDERSIVDVTAGDLAGYDQAHFFAGIGGWSLALRLAGWPDDRPVWTGSCPCQPFSNAGKRRGVEDERHLWPEFRRLIAEYSPPVVFGEQVASADGRDWLAGVRSDLEGMGYAVGAADLCAAGIGEAPGSHVILIEAKARVLELADRCGDPRLTGELRDFAGELGRLIVGSAPHIRQRLWWVADADHDGRAPGAGTAAGARHGHSVVADGDAGHVGDADDAGPQGRHQLRHGPGERPLGEAGRVGRVEHPEGDGRLERRAEPSGWGAVGGRGEGFWSAFDLLPCTDGKARRVEPGTFPLAHGVPNRVGRLRAYGNAIVPQVAAEFIGAWLETRP